MPHVHTPKTFMPDDSALSFESLNAIRQQARSGSIKGQAEVARQFEALFIQQLLKQARSASQAQASFLESDQTRLAQSLADEQMAQQLATPGIGLAQALLAQMATKD